MRILLLLSGLVFASLLAACGAESEAAVKWRAEGDTLSFTVHDMSCTGCESTVKSRLGALEGVASVAAAHDTDLVTVTLAPGTDREALKPRIGAALAPKDSPEKKFTVVDP